MEFKVQCPSCGTTLKLRDESLLGKAIRCPKCRCAIRLPASLGSKGPGSAAAPAKSKPEHPASWEDEYQDEDVWNSVSPDGRDEEEDTDSYSRDEFDDDLNDFSDRGEEETFTDNFSAPTALPPRRTQKVVKPRPVEKRQRPNRPFPWAIVIAAVAVVCVLGLLVPLVLTVKNIVTVANLASQQQETMNNMKQIGLGFHNFHDVYGSFPIPKTTRHAPPEWFDKNGKPYLSWRVHILPYLDEADLYQQFHLNEPWDSEHNKSLVAKMPKVFSSAGIQVQSGCTCLQAPSGKGTIMEGGLACGMRDITDGTSNTAMVIQTESTRAVPWTKPADYEVDPGEASIGLYFANDVTLILTCDGAVHRVQRNAAETNSPDGAVTSILSLLFTRADGAAIGEF